MNLERAIARLVTAGTYVSVGLLAFGVVGLLAAGRSPLDGGPSLDPGQIVGDIVALRPEGFLWLGLLVAIASPAARVMLALGGYLRLGERGMAVVAVLILGVIALSVGLAIGTEG
ncbi:MAG TPA: DUF1634 domain-containing protein [Candidatus Limnocylindrales bacterium]|nr:DUF1634 domain-containing protein [Candidatus Limnocylindrales bacterium]